MSCTCAAPQVAPEPLPRSRWSGHVRFPEQTLLLASHDNFRRVSRLLCDTASVGAADPEWRSFARSLFLRWQAAMVGGHERYEERKLYPYLARRFGVEFHRLEVDHQRLHALADEVVDRLGTGEGLSEALQAYDTAMGAHLDAEEALVIPLLLAMSPEEFTRFGRQDLATLLADLDVCAASPSA
ncbi:MAG: hypothetical protein ACI8PZ_007209 [Myxococcota bacterium]|jgi:hypothetical protein